MLSRKLEGFDLLIITGQGNTKIYGVFKTLSSQNSCCGTYALGVLWQTQKNHSGI